MLSLFRVRGPLLGLYGDALGSVATFRTFHTAATTATTTTVLETLRSALLVDLAIFSLFYFSYLATTPKALARFLRIIMIVSPSVAPTPPPDLPLPPLPSLYDDIDLEMGLGNGEATQQEDDGFHWSDIEMCMAALPDCLQQNATQGVARSSNGSYSQAAYSYALVQAYQYQYQSRYGFGFAAGTKSNASTELVPIQETFMQEKQEDITERSPTSKPARALRRSTMDVGLQRTRTTSLPASNRSSSIIYSTPLSPSESSSSPISSPNPHRHSSIIYSTSPSPSTSATTTDFYSRKPIGHTASRHLDELFAQSRYANNQGGSDLLRRKGTMKTSGKENGNVKEEDSEEAEKRRRRRRWLSVRDAWPSFASVVAVAGLA